MKLISFLILVGLFSCGSSPTKKDNTAPVSKFDFKKPSGGAYKAQQDVFILPSPPTNASLADESIFRLEKSSFQSFEASENIIEKIIALCYQGQIDKGLQLAKQYHFSFEKNPSYWNQVGTCYLLKNDDRKSLLYYNKALEVMPNYTPALNNLAVYFTRKNEFAKAHVALLKAQKSSSFSKTPRFNLAQLYLSFGLAQESVTLFQGLYEQNSGDVDVIIGLGQSYLSLNMPEKSYDYFKRVPDTHRSRPEISVSFALAASMIGKKEEAQALLKYTNNLPGEYKNYFEKTKKIIEGR